MAQFRSLATNTLFTIAAALWVLSETTTIIFPFASAVPVELSPRASSLTVLDDLLLLDAPAVTASGQTTAEIEAYVFKRQIDLGPLTDGLNSALKSLGLGALGNAGDRAKLFATSGKDGKSVDVNVDGCSNKATVGPTDKNDLGLAIRNVSLGECRAGSGQSTFSAKADLASIDLREKTLQIFPSAPDGFGVISDIDDTVKVSHVLDKLQLAKATFFDEPAAVTGMPELYTSLSKSLGSPAFFYVSGSPYQLYPFLQPFISSAYSASRGPLFLRNLTLSDVGSVLDLLVDKDATFNFKSATIDRLKGLYPQKKFLMIGDSTEKDPETYGEAFRKYGDSFASCIWIRRVDGADNSEQRFSQAFQGVPQNKIRVFNDSDITGMQNVDLKGGSC